MRSCQTSAGVAMLLGASSGSVVKKSRHKRPTAAAALIGRRRSSVRQSSSCRLSYCAGLLLALVSVLLLALIATSAPFGLVEAKIHHSKRQAPISSFSSPTTPSLATTGRENTNWWNVWWQQYIDEAEQPTVRPIVGVTFNGRTINLSDQSVRSADDEESVSDGSVNLAADDSANSIGDSSPPLDQAQDLERSAKSQPGGVARQAAPSGSPRTGKAMQERLQGNWQNVRPTMLQPKAAAMRDLRPSRQTEQQQQRDDEDPAQMQLGIQMRNTMNSQKRRPQQQQLLPPPPPQLQQQQQQQQPRWKQRQQQQMQQQQQLLQQAPIEFEQQQQNQMVDYSEDGEPELEGAQLEGDQPRATTQGQARDSSSSSMMAPEQPEVPKTTTSTTVRPARTGEEGVEQSRPTTPAATVAAGAMEMRKPQQTADRKQQQRPAQKGQPMILIPGKKPMVAPAVATTTTATPVAGGEQSSTERSAPTSTSLPPTTPATSTTTAQPVTTTVDLNETPISLGNGDVERQTPSQQPSTSMTTPGGRVALENGRPASRQQPQATTTSARLPTGKSLSKTTPTQTTTSIGSSTEAAATTTAVPPRSMAPITTTQAFADSSPTTVATTSSSVDSSMTTTGSPMPTTTTVAAAGSRVSAAREKQAGQPMPALTTTTGMTPTTTTAGASTGEAAEAETEETEGETGQPGEGEDEEDDEEEEQPTTTTAKPATARQQAASSQTPAPMSSTPTAATGGAATSSAPTTQQPPLATMDLERLPKGPAGTGTTGSTTSKTSLPTTMSMTMTTGQQQQQQPGPTSASPAADGSTSRPVRPTTSSVMPASPERPRAQDATRDEFGFMFMPDQAGKTTPPVVSGDTPITMQMDQLMRLMMGGQTTTTMTTAAQDASAGTSPRTFEDDFIRVSPATETTQQPVQTTTAQTPTTTSPAAEQTSTVSRAPTAPGGSSSSSMPTTTMSASMQTEVGGGSSSVSAGTESPSAQSTATTPSGAMVTLARMMERENELLADQLMPGGRKRLQPPPPTTRAPGPDQMLTTVQQREREQLGPTSAPPSASGSTSMATERPEVPLTSNAQRTVMLDLDQQQQQAEMGSKGVGMAGEDGKIEMLNLDLMPIQRIMNQQTAARLNMVGVQPPAGRQKQKQQPPVAGQMFMEVEPGMRLRPVTGTQTQTVQPQQQQPQQMAGFQAAPARMLGQQQPSDERANTVYMIMMSSPSPAGGSQPAQQPKQKPITVIEMMQSPPGTQQMMRSQTLGAKQRGQQQVAGSKTASQAPSASRGSQEQTSTTSSAMRTTSDQLRMTTTPRGQVGATKTVQEKEGERQQQIMMMMSTLGALPTEPTQAPTTSTTSRSRRPMLMENAIEMDMQMGAISRQKESVKMQKLNELPGRQMMIESMAKSTLPSATTSTTVQAATTTSTIGGDQSSIMTTTSSPMDTVRLSTTAIKSSSQDSTIGPVEALSTPSSSLPPMTTAARMTTTTAPFTMTTTSAAAIPGGTTGGGNMTPAGVSSPSAMAPTEAPTDQMASQTSSSALEKEGAMGGGGPAAASFGGRPAIREGTSQAAGDNNQQPQQGGRSQQFERIQQQPQQPMTATGSRTTTTGDRRPQPQQQQPSQTGVKSGRSGASKTSSFIPSRLRTDFAPSPATKLQLNKTQSQTMQPELRKSTVASTTGSPILEPMVQNLAIRQFGGANRMSVLANKPVAFGRPASVTIQNQQSARLTQQQQSRANRIEVPSFEYGPSIAVRRPDEPLANGQMPNCTLTGKNFCVLTKDYPMNEVRQAVERSFRSVRIMYEELQTVSDQDIHKDLINTNATNQAATGQFACQTQVEMMRPGWAKDEITKEWMLVVNTDVFPQRVRTESCAQPNTPCEFIAPFYDSTCQQRYSLHRMIAIDPHDPSRSPQVAMFRFPAGCVCRVHPIKKFFSSTTTTSQQTTTTTSVPSTTSSQRASAK